jgi:branched-subunit amino acid ABC-type transport system permease component
VDGITNGAVYGLVALSLIVVYTVTRVVNIAQGEYVTLGALSFASALSGSFSVLSAIVPGGPAAAFALKDLADRRLAAAAKMRILAVRGRCGSWSCWRGVLAPISFRDPTGLPCWCRWWRRLRWARWSIA